MNEWQPIEKYDKLKKKPRHAIFWFKELSRPRDTLEACVNTRRYMGYRECTHFMPFDPPIDG